MANRRKFIGLPGLRVSATRGTSRGFTLLEVLMALAVLAIALAALVKAAGNNAHNAIYLKEKTLAHWIAMNKAAEWRLQDQWPGVGKQTGTVLMAEQEWRWQITTFETPDKDVKRIEIAVFPDDDEVEEPTVRRIAYLGRPG